MNDSELKTQLQCTVSDLFSHQADIFDFTSETVQTEWNLAHHFAIELTKRFPDLDCDLDIIKPNYERRRPDIILHRRGSHSSNLLVVEIKRDGDRREIEADIEKIQHFWFREPLSYEFGAVIDLRSDKSSDIIVFQNQVNLRTRKTPPLRGGKKSLE